MTGALGIRRIAACVVVVHLAAAAGVAAAQELDWVRQFGSAQDDGAYAVATDSAGLVYVAGSTHGTLPGQSSAGDWDAFLAKYDTWGRQLWMRQFGGAGSDSVSAIATDPAGYVYVAGWVSLDDKTEEGFHFTEGMLARFDPAGNQVWVRMFDTPGFFRTALNAVAADAQGNVYVAGEAVHTNSRPGASFLARYDAAGSRVWAQPFTPDGDARGVAVDSLGDVYVVGSTDTASTPLYDAVLARYDSNGNQLWIRQFDTGWSDFLTDVASDGLGHVYVTGISGWMEPELSLVAQYDADGNQVWIREADPWVDTPATFGAVVTDTTGNAYVAAGIPVEAPGEVLVIKYDVNGSVSWTRQFGTTQSEYGYDLAIGHGDLYIAGWTQGTFAWQVSAGRQDAFIARLVLPADEDPSQQIAAIRTTLAGMTMHHGIARSLDAKLTSAARALERGWVTAACGALGAFLNHLDAQNAKKVSRHQAGQLAAAADVLRSTLGCR